MKDVLLRIIHSDFSLSIAGPKPIRESYALRSLANTEFLPVHHPDILKAVETTTLQLLCKIEHLGAWSSQSYIVEYLSTDSSGNPLPLFFEHIEYTFLLRYIPRSSYNLWHEDHKVLSGLSEFRDKNEVILSGNVNFKNNVGETNFHLKLNGMSFLKILVNVFSTKLDYFHQRPSMMREIQRLHNSTLWELLKPTSTSATQSNQKITGIEWITLFNQHFNTLLSLIRRIEHKSHSKLNSRVELKSIAKLKGSNKYYNSQLRKYGAEHVSKTHKIWSDKKVITNDTEENRYVKFVLFKLVKTGKSWIHYIENYDIERRNAFIQSPYFQELKGKVTKLDKTLKAPFWNAIKGEKSILKNRTSFAFHHDFLKTEQLTRKLKTGLKYDKEGTEKVYVLSMDLLYQLWSYIKIAEVITRLTFTKEEIKLKSSSGIDFQTSVLTGKESEIKLTDEMSLLTERLFTKSGKPYRIPIVAQKPDITLHFLKRHKLVLFDAKYRINLYVVEPNGRAYTLSNQDLISIPIAGKIVNVSPQDEDINVIHRYRDAIYVNDPANFKHAVMKGYIIFPGVIDSKSLEISKASVENFGLGYLPLSPGLEDVEWYSQYPYDFERDTKASNMEDVRAVAEALYNVISDS